MAADDLVFFRLHDLSHHASPPVPLTAPDQRERFARITGKTNVGDYDQPDQRESRA